MKETHTNGDIILNYVLRFNKNIDEKDRQIGGEK